MRSRKRPVGALAVVVASALTISLAVAAPATAAPKFPTWADVQRAKHSVAAKRAEVKKITALIAGLQQDAAAAGKVALERGEDYLNAKNALEAATTKASKLESQANAAKQQATTSGDEAGQLAAQLARSGGSSLTMQLLLNGHGASDLLDVLGTASKLTENTATIFAQAQQDKNTAKSLGDEAAVAEAARAKKSAAAQTALAAATSAATTAQNRVTAQNKAQTVLTAQLASLTGKSKKTEAAYFAGVAWEKKQEAQTAPPADGTPTGPIPGAPSGSAVAGAIRFAEDQLGEPYVLDGMGPNVWDCSGLTKAAYASVGVYIGTHSATDQYNTLRAENRLVPLSERVAGDILWYSDGGSTSAVKYHVTLYIGNGQMIEAPYPGATVRIRPVRFGDLVPYAGRPTG
jgi:cell wall-associated NlpC family hydrolase